LTLLKSVVICLALANVGYFLWSHGIMESRAPPPARPAVMTLKLASEAAGNPGASAAAPTATDSGVAGSSSGAPADAANDKGVPLTAAPP